MRIEITKILNLVIANVKFSRVISDNIKYPNINIPEKFRPIRTSIFSARYKNQGMNYFWFRIEPNGNIFTHNECAENLSNLETTIVYQTSSFN